MLLASLAALGCVAGCAGGGPDGASAASKDDSVTEVAHSRVKDQSSDNCWLYATMGWVESMHLSATGEELDLSESYLTYWHWFEQITSGWVENARVEEGGSWGHAANLMLRYGMVAERDFIPREESMLLSERQAEAVKAINRELKEGALRYGAARRNPVLVRETLDRAWRLTSRTTGWLNRTFGRDGAQTLDTFYERAALPENTPVRRPSDIAVKLRNPTTGRIEDRTVRDAIGVARSADDSENRRGELAWQEAVYPRTAPARKNFWKRVKRALNDRQPVIVSWTIDDNAFTPQGTYPDVPAQPGPQGGHMVLGYDYAVDGVPGVGSLEAGELVTDPHVLAATLDDAATVRFLRVKNSWSTTYHPLAAPAPAGYHDLYLKYLNGPMPFCAMDAQGKPILDRCEPGVPLESVVLPAGY